MASSQFLNVNDVLNLLMEMAVGLMLCQGVPAVIGVQEKVFMEGLKEDLALNFDMAKDMLVLKSNQKLYQPQ